MKKLFFLFGLLAFALISFSPPADHDVGNTPTHEQSFMDLDSQTSVDISAIEVYQAPSFSVENQYSYVTLIEPLIKLEIKVCTLLTNPVEKGSEQVCTNQNKPNLNKDVEYIIKGPIINIEFAHYKTPLLKYTNTHFGSINKFV